MNALAAMPDPDPDPDPDRNADPDGDRCPGCGPRPATASLALQLARWFEQRLHDSMAAHSSLLRAYALDVLDAEALARLGEAAARACFVVEVPTRDDLDRHPAVAAARAADAVAVVSTRWLAVPGHPARPGEFARRRRARVVQVVADSGAASVARFDDAPEVVVVTSAA